MNSVTLIGFLVVVVVWRFGDFGGRIEAAVVPAGTRSVGIQQTNKHNHYVLSFTQNAINDIIIIIIVIDVLGEFWEFLKASFQHLLLIETEKP